MAAIKAQPCEMGTSKFRDNPANPEMALAFALHDYAQHLERFSQPQLMASSPDAFSAWLKTVEHAIAFYRKNFETHASA